MVEDTVVNDGVSDTVHGQAGARGGLTAGKLRAMVTLADDDGMFRMVAVDQRPPLFAALARAGGRDPSSLAFDEIARAKAMLVRVLAPEAGAMLLDPVWAHPQALLEVPGTTALISTLEDYGFEADAHGERRSRLIEGWSVAAIKRSGASGVKLLAWYRPDASEATRRHQQELVARVGDACRQHDIPFILELLAYPLAGEEAGSEAYVARQPERVLASLRDFADERFGVDLYKVEFPTPLRWCRGFAGGAFDGVVRPELSTLDEVRAALREIDAICPSPWVLLSAGVGAREFALDLELACEAGASGFLAGRAVWMNAFDAYPDEAAVERSLRDEGVATLRSLAALASRGRPWTQHRRFAGGPRLAGAGEGWYLGYAEETS